MSVRGSLCNAELANIEGILKAFDSCSDIFYKEMFLGEDVLGGILTSGCNCMHHVLVVLLARNIFWVLPL